MTPFSKGLIHLHGPKIYICDHIYTLACLKFQDLKLLSKTDQFMIDNRVSFASKIYLINYKYINKLVIEQYNIAYIHLF